MRYLFALTLLLLAGACASTTAILPSVQVIDSPSLNTVTTAELGETVVEKGLLRTYQGLALSNDLQWGDGLILKKFTVSPGRLKARQQDARFTYFYSEDMTSYDAILGTRTFTGGGLCQARDGSGPVKGFVVVGKCRLNWNAQPIVSPIRVQDVNAPGVRQELIYTGRSGDSLKFLYREFMADVMRPPFSQDIQYDLSESAIIGFRGLRIEVIEATNTQLTYRVLATFPDLP